MIIERLLRRFLSLQSAKWHLVYTVYHKQAKYFEFHRAVGRLKRIILQETRLLQKIEAAGEKALLRVENCALKRFLSDSLKLCGKIIIVLRQEYWLLCSSRPSSLRKNVQLVDEQGGLFQEMFNRELELSRRFEKMLDARKGLLLGVKGLGKSRREIELARFLLKQLRVVFMELLKAADIREAARANREIERIISLLQRTEVYGYIKNDVEFIMRKSKDVMQNPGRSRVMYFLLGAYIVAPFTFEATGAILSLKYITKYTVSKGRKIKQKLQGKKSLMVLERLH